MTVPVPTAPLNPPIRMKRSVPAAMLLAAAMLVKPVQPAPSSLQVRGMRFAQPPVKISMAVSYVALSQVETSMFSIPLVVYENQMSGPPPAAHGQAVALGVAAVVSKAVGAPAASATAPVHSSFWAKAGEVTATAARRKGIFFISEQRGEMEAGAARSRAVRSARGRGIRDLYCAAIVGEP